MQLIRLVLSGLVLISSFVHANNACIMETYDQEVVDQGNSLKDLEQKELLNGTCKKYFKESKRIAKSKSKMGDQEYNRLTVLCGKWMFLNLGMRTDIGIPKKIYKIMEKFDEVGPKLQKLGFLSDDSWESEEYPFGVVKVSHEKRFAFKRIGANKIIQMSCAACHTAEMPDGRFVLGTTNEKLEYGKFNIYTMFSVWMMDKKKNDESRWLPEIIEYYKELDRKYSFSFLKFLETVSYFPANELFIRKVVGEEPAPLITQKSFLESSPGIYNGFAPSVNFVDREIYLTPPQLYGLGQDNEAHYGSLAGLESLDSFISEALIYTNRSNRYNKEMYIKPIKEYLRCMKAPKNNAIKNEIKFEQGARIFSNSCISCHDQSHGGGSATVSPEIIKTPKSYLDLFISYKPVDEQSRKTYGLIEELNLNRSADTIKVRRLSGIWTRQKLTSNGQIQGLDHLFCLNREREVLDSENPRTQSIHQDLCTDYSIEEKEALKEYLKHF